MLGNIDRTSSEVTKSAHQNKTNIFIISLFWAFVSLAFILARYFIFLLATKDSGLKHFSLHRDVFNFLLIIFMIFIIVGYFFGILSARFRIFGKAIFFFLPSMTLAFGTIVWLWFSRPCVEPGGIGFSPCGGTGLMFIGIIYLLITLNVLLLPIVKSGQLLTEDKKVLFIQNLFFGSIILLTSIFFMIMLEVATQGFKFHIVSHY